MDTLRTSLIRLASTNSELRPHLLPLLKEAGNLEEALNPYHFEESGFERREWDAEPEFDRARKILDEAVDDAGVSLGRVIDKALTQLRDLYVVSVSSNETADEFKSELRTRLQQVIVKSLR